jgi:predicted dehydrogenase
VALVDPSAASIDRLVERNPGVATVPRFESHTQMLDRVRPDAVEISTPHGSKGSIYYRESGVRGAPRRFQQRWFDRPDVVTEPALPAGSDPDTNFVDAIRGRAAVQSPPTCGLRVIELTEAAWRSARTNAPADVRQLALA